MQTHVAQVTRVYYTVQNTEGGLGGWNRGAGFVGAPGQCVTPVTNREEQRQGWMRWQSGSGSGRVLRTKNKTGKCRQRYKVREQKAWSKIQNPVEYQ